jgi:beta-galactosidase
MSEQTPSPADSTRQRFLFDPQWRFFQGDPDFNPAGSPEDAFFQAHLLPAAGPAGVDFDDQAWRLVDLPHDWAVEGAFDPQAEPNHGSRPTGIGWYRKSFNLAEEDRGKRIYLEFDGAFRNSTLWINGYLVGRQPSGYTSFHYDISDLLNFGGTNLVAVRLDATQFEGWWYEGAGIYRHVWLLKVSPVHVIPWGVFVHAQPAGPGGAAWEVTVETELANQSEQACDGIIISTILDAAGNVVATVRSELSLASGVRPPAVKQSAQIDHPRVWSLDDPYLYHLKTELHCGDRPVDGCETSFGLRTLRFDAQQGFFLNEQPVKLKGACNHQDHAGVGVAIPDRLYEYRIRRLQEMGCNAYRCSHNPPAPELLDACDRMGMLVMDETRHLDSSPQGLFELDSLLRRDRNHPCIFLWSLGNEEPIQKTDAGGRIAASLKRLVHRLDPTRQVTQAMNGGWGGLNSDVLDVQGFNYNIQEYDAFHEKFPGKPCLVTESGSTVGTRGIYTADPQQGFVSAYDHNYLPWPASAEDTWKAAAHRPFVSGTFVWTGFDYRGEPTPYKWPCVNSHFGILDTCGFPKDNFFYYQAWWSQRTVLHILPHWNWPGREDQLIDVWCFSNCAEVELVLNGTSLGRKAVPENSHLEWPVAYTPGVLAARGYRDNQEIAYAERRTTGAPARLTLHPDRKTICADGEDVVVVNVSIEDEHGLVVPYATDLVHFKVSGSARILGVGNGNPSSHEADKASQRSAFGGLCQAILQATTQPGEILLVAEAQGLPRAGAAIKAEESALRPRI